LPWVRARFEVTEIHSLFSTDHPTEFGEVLECGELPDTSGGDTSAVYLSEEVRVDGRKSPDCTAPIRNRSTIARKEMKCESRICIVEVM